MRVEVLKAYGPHSVGAIIPDMPANEARTRIERGQVQAAGFETAAMASPANRMMTAPVQRAGRAGRRHARQIEE